MTTSALRSRVERLLSGDVREQDLHHLFLNMREEGRKSVIAEIAHFLAHPEKRTKGMVTKEARDALSFLKFRWPLAQRRIISSAIPADMPQALRANLRRTKASTLKRRTGTNLKHAGRVLERILSRLQPAVSGGGFVGPLRLNEEEARIFVFLSS
jgi:hypothetical protein